MDEWTSRHMTAGMCCQTGCLSFRAWKIGCLDARGKHIFMPRRKLPKYVCADAWWASQLSTYTYNPRCKVVCGCQLCLKPKFHIPGMQIRMWHCGIHVFRTPLSPSDLFFLGKRVWTLELGGWNQNFTTQIVKIWIQSSDSHLHQSLHGAIQFFAFCNGIHSRTYGITLVRLCFPFLSDLHNAYHIYGISA